MAGRWGARALRAYAEDGARDANGDVEAKKAELKRRLKAGEITPAEHDAELRKILGSLSFKSNRRDPYRISHGSAQKFIPSREQH